MKLNKKEIKKGHVYVINDNVALVTGEIEGSTIPSTIYLNSDSKEFWNDGSFWWYNDVSTIREATKEEEGLLRHCMKLGYYDDNYIHCTPDTVLDKINRLIESHE